MKAFTGQTRQDYAQYLDTLNSHELSTIYESIFGCNPYDECLDADEIIDTLIECFDESMQIDNRNLGYRA